MMNTKCSNTTPSAANLRSIYELRLCRIKGLCSPDRLNQLVELLKKTGSVALLERRRTTSDLSCTSEFLQQISSRKGLADIVVGERLSGRAKDAGAFLQATARKRNIGGDDDVPGLHVLDDPVVGGVKSVSHDFEYDPPFVRSAHPRVGYQRDLEATPVSNPEHLLFDWTRISIDKDM